jgi:taurine dioxygenase
MMTNLKVEKLAPACGAIVRGFNLAEIDDAGFETLKEIWHEHLVLFFPEQHEMVPQVHREFAMRFGELEIHPHAEKFSLDLPEICVLNSERGGRADVWHSDVTYTPSPPVGVLVRYVQGPSIGGDTLWSNQYMAFESLSTPIRDLISGLSALHMSTIDQAMSREFPVVRTHPETGRNALYVNRLFTRALSELLPGESDALLHHLFEWAEKPEFTCRWRWSPGDMALWDNRCVLHRAINDYADERVLHRAMILGDEPEGPPARWNKPVTPIQSSSVGYEHRGKGALGR